MNDLKKIRSFLCISVILLSFPVAVFAASTVYLDENTLLAAPCDNDGDIVIENSLDDYEYAEITIDF